VLKDFNDTLAKSEKPTTLF